mmetsp:Transcript_16111/g.66429  ORF Transcript_16111/g.66429 Transcript_16111/m.66429 type:complete len:205 (+) Transcript_16111:1957-2571(+)
MFPTDAANEAARQHALNRSASRSVTSKSVFSASPATVPRSVDLTDCRTGLVMRPNTFALVLASSNRLQVSSAFCIADATEDASSTVQSPLRIFCTASLVFCSAWLISAAAQVLTNHSSLTKSSTGDVKPACCSPCSLSSSAIVTVAACLISSPSFAVFMSEMILTTYSPMSALAKATSACGRIIARKGIASVSRAKTKSAAHSG